jgi:uncharacterized delta-60 repeat protein
MNKRASAHLLRARPPAARPARHRLTARPALEALEDRCLLSVGGPDATFNGTGERVLTFMTANDTSQANAVAVQPDGKILAAGRVQTTVIANSLFAVARFNADGSLDPSFNGAGKVTIDFGFAGGNGQATGVALQADGKIIVSGFGNMASSGQRDDDFAVARLNGDGSLDTSFNSTGEQTVRFQQTLPSFDHASAVAVQPDGRILVAGSASDGINNSFAVARFLDNGTPDPAFGTGGKQRINVPNPTGSEQDSPLNSMALQGDGKIVLAGSADQQGAANIYEFAVARFNPDGSLDQTFGGNGPRSPNFGPGVPGIETIDFNGGGAQGNAVAIDSLGRIVEVGTSPPAAGSNSQFAVARLTGVDPFGPGMFDAATETWYLQNRARAGAPDAGRFAYGAAGWIPVVGDWNGDGVATVGVVDPSTMTWYLRNTNSAGAPDLTPFAYGAPGDVPVVGDWTGSGTTTIGVFRPSNATWYLRNSNSAGAPDLAPFAYGASYMKPVAGDWNGDGTWTVGAFDPSGNGAWLLRNSNSPGAPDVAPFAYGANVWTPVAGHYGFPALPLAQMAAGGEGPGAAEISTGDLDGIVQAALGRLQQAGVSPALLGHLSAVTALLQPLAPGQLGEALPQQNTIVLSPDGAGHGWFVDPTPYQDEEFAGGTAYAGSPAAGREDLLTTVLHELGHLAGLADDNGTALMAESLPTGTRRTDALGAVFANNAVPSFAS